MTKVLVVGLDGATFDIIRPLVADGRLPTLAHLMQNGAWGYLSSTIPPITPAAWTSFFTGKNPGKHGIYDFQEPNRQTYEFKSVRVDRHREKTVWQLLGEANLRSLIMDVPFTYPPQPLNGWMMTGYGTPRTAESNFTYPANLVNLLPASLQAEVRVALPANTFDRSQQFIDEWVEVMNGRRRLMRALIKEQEWNLFMLVFSITDNMAHVFWTFVDPAHPNYHRPEGEKYRQAFFHAYELCDQLLGELMELAGPETTTLVISDHGFGSVRPRQYIFQRLLQGGYIASKGSGSGGTSKWLARTAVNTYNRLPFLREWVKSLRPNNRAQFLKTLNRAGIAPNTRNIDFSRSKIIPTNFGLQMWVNEQDRFAQGLISAADKESVLRELSEYLQSDLDPTSGRPIISQTYLAQHLYHGPFLDDAPDLIIEHTNFYQPEIANRISNPYVEGGHTPLGIFLAYGPHITPESVRDASLIDLTPTILHLFDQEIPQDMDGRVLTEIFSEAYLARHPIRQGNTIAQHQEARSGDWLTADQEADLNEQLRQLGYI